MRILVSTFFFSVLVLISLLAKSQTVGLVLSGGGMRGFAHIGVIRALEENNIPINYITGTSSGALIGALYSVGYTPDEMERLVTSPAFIKLAQGIFDEENLYYFKNNQPDASWATIKFFIDSVLHTQLPSNVVNTAEIDFELMEILTAPTSKAGYNFDSLMIPFRCVATDITNKKSILFRNGDLAMAVRASMAFPFYYSPVLLGNKILYDGGIYNNFPVDVMLSEFNPDVIIGSNAASVPDVPTEGNFLTQIRTMLSQTTVYQVPRPNDFLIEPEIKYIGSFDFDRIKIAIDSGYFSTLQIMDSIKFTTTKRTEKETLREARYNFKQNNEYSIDQIYVHGLNENQSSYVQKVINPANGPFSIEQFRKGYFMLVADDNFRYIYPHLLSNPQTGKYDLHLDVRQDKTIRVDLGANFSSRPINTGYIGFRYNFLSRQSFRLNTNLYFGKLYNSVHAKIRWDIPGKSPIYIEPSLTINQWDFYKSSSAFFEDVKPSFIVSYDRSYALHAGIPVRNKGKVIAGLNQFRLNNRYYQTRSFSVADTADLTRFDGMSLYIDFERNTLNRKMYANQGTYFNIRFRYVVGTEKTIPGSTNVQLDAIKKNHDWPQFTVTYDNYFKRWGSLKLGFYSELNFSGQPFFANYTSSMISSPAFYPTQESRTLFLENFRSHNYVGAGLKQVWSIFTNVDLRAEAFIFQPFQAIRSSAEDKAVYDEAFKNRYFIGTLNTVYNSPIGPVSISLNYYDDRDKPFTIMFHLGYIIFNKKALY